MGEFIRDRLPDPVSYFESQGQSPKGPGKWKTMGCTFHGGSDSMRINSTTGTWVCMAGCGARGGDVLSYHMAAHGLDFMSAAKDLGAWVDDGKPSKQQRPKPLPATEAIRVLAFESNLTAIAAGNIAHGVQLSDKDRARLMVAAGRIQHVAEVFA